VWPLALVSLMSSVALSACGGAPTNTADDPSFQDAKSKMQAEDAIKVQLRDPNSAQFKDEIVLSKHGDPTDVIVCGYVNAKNGFGGRDGFERFVWASQVQTKPALHGGGGHTALEEAQPRDAMKWGYICDKVQARGAPP
jgi:hypothetical protein